MERLWAPWRMEYITEEPRAGCLFCRAIENPDGPDAELVVWRPQGAIVMLNKFPYNPGHAMVAPIAHKGDLVDLDAAQSADLMQALKSTIAALRSELKPEGFNIGVNLGRVAGAGIPDHVHIHVVPRWNGDTNFMTTIAEARVLPESLDATFAKLQAAWPS